MKLVIDICLITIVLGLSTSTTCPMYECGSQNCAEYNGSTNTYSVNPCPEGQTCTMSNGVGSCQPMGITYAWPGQKCSSSVPCKYGTCNGTCQGKKSGETCAVDDECNPGLFCSLSGTCTTQLKANKDGCYGDFYCENNLGCNNDPETGAGECIPYLSYSSHNQLLQKCDTINYLCSSTLCGTKDNQNYCTDPLKSQGSLPQTCTSPDTLSCLSTSDKFFDTAVQLKEKCACGQSSTGAAYCPQFPGDADYLKYISQLNKWYKSGKGKSCNTTQRHSFSCMQQYWDDDEYVTTMYYYYKTTSYANLQGAKDCVIKTLSHDYYSALEEYNNINDKDDDIDDDSHHSDWASVLCGSIILIFL